MPVVELIDVSRSFGPVRAVRGLSLAVEAGEIFGLVGPDGAGKTTALRLLTGLLAPDEGRVMVLGQDVGARSEAVKHEIGYMSQRFGLYDELTVAENIEFYAELYQTPRKEYKERMARLLKFSGLAPFTGRLFRNLSGGMKQKVGLTAALIHTPKVLFLDEPTNGVDPVSRRDFWKILYELKREKVTILVATTYLDEADRCHRVAILDQGRARVVMEPLAMRAMIRGQLFSLAVGDRRAGLKVLRGLPQALAPNIYGARLHFSLENEDRLPAVLDALEGAGVKVEKSEPAQPTLEDVYISLLTEKKEQAA